MTGAGGGISRAEKREGDMARGKNEVSETSLLKGLLSLEMTPP
jgi:hypothetical protein